MQKISVDPSYLHFATTSSPHIAELFLLLNSVILPLYDFKQKDLPAMHLFSDFSWISSTVGTKFALEGEGGGLRALPILLLLIHYTIIKQI